MSINCSNFCLYQIDGTCTLKKKVKQPKKKGNFLSSDCIHFSEKDISTLY